MTMDGQLLWRLRRGEECISNELLWAQERKGERKRNKVEERERKRKNEKEKKKESERKRKW